MSIEPALDGAAELDTSSDLPACSTKLADEVWQRFSRQLIDLARKNLSTRIRRKEDPEEVVQSALRSFYRRRDNKLITVSDWDSLRRILIVITLRKCRGRARKYFTESRDLDREQDLLNGVDASELAGGEPTPEQAATLADLVEHLMTRLIDDRERKMLELALQGHTTEEIARVVDRSSRTVARVLKRVREYLVRVEGELLL